jgi:hypothetical protein
MNGAKKRATPCGVAAVDRRLWNIRDRKLAACVIGSTRKSAALQPCRSLDIQCERAMFRKYGITYQGFTGDLPFAA